MDGEEVKVLEARLSFIASMIQELRDDTKANTDLLTRVCDRITHIEAWRTHHEQNHSKISDQLGKLPTLIENQNTIQRNQSMMQEDIRTIHQEIKALNGDVKKFSAISGGSVAAGFAAIKELVTYFFS